MRIKTSDDFLKKRAFPWKLLVAFIAVLVLVAAVGMLAGILGTGGNLRHALEMGRLAKLPDSATGVMVGGTGDTDNVTLYLRFAAPPEDIDKFIADSFGVGHLPPKALGPDHMCLPATARSTDADEAARHVYFGPDARYPWFDPTVRTKGRLYVIPRNLDGNSGEIIIDDESHVVYVKVWHSQ